MNEQHVQQLEQQLSDANAQLNNLRQQYEQLQREADKRVAAAKQVTDHTGQFHFMFPFRCTVTAEQLHNA